MLLCGITIGSDKGLPKVLYGCICTAITFLEQKGVYSTEVKVKMILSCDTHVISKLTDRGVIGHTNSECNSSHSKCDGAETIVETKDMGVAKSAEGVVNQEWI